MQRLLKGFSLLIYSAAAVGGIWLSVRFLLPWASPFILAFALAGLLEPGVKALIRQRWKRSAAAGVLTLGLLAGIVWAVFTLLSRLIGAATDFAKQAPLLMSALGDALDSIEERLFLFLSPSGQGPSDFMSAAVEAVGDALYGIPAVISQWLLDALGRAAQNSPGAVLYLVTAGIGTYFFSASFPQTKAFLLAQLPEELRRKAEGLGQELKQSFGGFLRAQLILMAMCFFQLLLCFLLLGIPGAAGIAALTALIDALPVFGTGIVLLPWALYSLILGRSGKGLGLLICWGLVNLLRSCTQAKLMGDRIGLEPIVSLLAVYVGWRVWRVWGMLLFPMLFVIIRQLNDKGIVKLWKTP